jgi:hypothetical protein
MTNPTSNFGWQMPTASDLVTDLPADFEVFGQAVDTSLADLKGGTTGQVLAKASNTNMDFTWVAQDDSNAIQNAIVDAKGDLIGATAADTPARLAVGTNGQVLTADSTAATGLAWATPAATNGPAFRAYRGTSDQTVTGSTATKIQFNTETFDTDSCYDPTTNYRFTPNKAGYYEVTCQILFQGAGAFGEVSIYKNGAQVTVHRDGPQEGIGYAQAVDLISMNGTTDYLEGYCYIQNGAGDEKVLAYSTTSYFNAVWIRSN